MWRILSQLRDGLIVRATHIAHLRIRVMRNSYQVDACSLTQLNNIFLKKQQYFGCKMCIERVLLVE